MGDHYVNGLIGSLEPFDDKPRAQNVLRAAEAHVVCFEFRAGQELHEHTARHAILVQALAGELAITSELGEFVLVPGAIAHVPAMVPHAVTAVTDATMTVTMLLGPQS